MIQVLVLFACFFFAEHCSALSFGYCWPLLLLKEVIRMEDAVVFEFLFYFSSDVVDLDNPQQLL